MKLPVSWLKDYIEVKDTPQKLAERLTMSGTAVEHVDAVQGDAVLGIEVTTNRPDCLSILGLAREVAALTGRKVRLPKIRSKVSYTKKFSKEAPRIRIEYAGGCALYTGRLLQGVRIGQSPSAVRQKLERVGVRAISNAVDATNWVLFEMGQPLHAFDFDNIKGGEIRVRLSRKGEKFLGINDVEYTLDDKTLVIADREDPIAIAGVIGGKGTEVHVGTKNILLESAYFDPALVRQAARRYKVATDSSYRFERGVDLGTVAAASGRAADLLLEWAGGRDAGFWAAEGRPLSQMARTLRLRPSRLEGLLGMPVPAKRISDILNHLGFKTKTAGKDLVSVTPLKTRRDIVQEADLIEEVLRVEGFEGVPSTLPPTHYAAKPIENPNALRANDLRRFLTHAGLDEIITYSLLSRKALADSAWNETAEIHKIVNPLSAEQEVFRPTLLTGLLQSLLFNVNRKSESLHFFEIGNCYRASSEKTFLGLGFYGLLEENWKRKSEAGFHDLKGLAENVLGFLRVPAWQLKPGGLPPCFENGARLEIDGESAGFLGAVKAAVRQTWDLPKEVFYAELDLSVLFSKAGGPSPKARPIPKYPSVRRDIAFVVDESVAAADLETVIREAGSEHLQEVRLFDLYTGKNIPKGKRSLAFSLSYQKETGTFTDDEILALQKAVGEALKARFGAEFR